MPDHESPARAAPTPQQPTDGIDNLGDRAKLFDLSLDLLCIAGIEDGYFKQVNPSVTRVLGWSREELLSRPIHEFMHPDDRERTLQGRARLAEGIPVRNFENRYLCKDGSYRWLSWQSTIEPGGKTVFAIARDITERRQTDQIRLMIEKLESNRILAGGLAHDFNNLLTSLLLNLEMIGLSGPCTDHQKQHLQQAGEAAQAARLLIRQLLDLSHESMDWIKATNLTGLLEQILEQSVAGSPVKVRFSVDPKLWPAQIESERIGQVIHRLALNAREAMPAGGTLHLDALNMELESGQLPPLPAGPYVCLRLRDEGPGIPAEVLPKVFDPYFSTKPRGVQKGMGLGLTFCHVIVQKHQGLLTLDSSAGKGTTVSCYLPATPPWQNDMTDAAGI